MRIDHLTLRHFKGFEFKEFSFHPEFNLLVGRNGTGKTSALDGLAVAMGSWLLGIKGAETRHIRLSEVMLADVEREDIDDNGERSFGINWEYLFPCEVASRGEVFGDQLAWSRSLNGPTNRTTYAGAVNIKRYAETFDSVGLRETWRSFAGGMAQRKNDDSGNFPGYEIRQ